MPAERTEPTRQVISPQEMLHLADRLKWKADETNDAHDHDELHAAAEVAFIIAVIHPDLRHNAYIARWLEALDG